MKLIRLFAVLGLVLFVADSQAGRRGRSSGGCQGGNCPAVQPAVTNVPTSMPATAPACTSCPAVTPATTAPAPKPAAVTDPLAQVNARRAAAGLRLYVHDPALTTAARSAATYRARFRIRGHVETGLGDFQFLPAGASATAAGCAAWPPADGFAACAMYDSYTYAGAATVIGDDGLAYHHLFVR